jgi:STE24 endopeptidase
LYDENVTTFWFLILGLILLRLAAKLILAWLSRTRAAGHAGQVPAVLAGMVDESTSRRAASYTMAKASFGMVDETWDHLWLALFLFSGFLPWLYTVLAVSRAQSNFGQALFVLVALLATQVISLPFGWWRTFKLEARFGFNKSTQGLWVSDLVKGLVLQVALGLPILLLIFKLAEMLGRFWWVWGFVALSLIQMVLMVLYPRLIMPLFNKFSPLPDGELKDRLFGLASRVKFPVKDIRVMDGSRRSGHSNAFFSGFGRWRRIVLFDTLVKQMEVGEMEAVLAHEIGHNKKGHVSKGLALSLASTLAGFWLVDLARQQDWLAQAFGFTGNSLGITLLLLLLGSDLFLFWLAPLSSALSRRFEYQADAYAAKEAGIEGGGGGALASSLKKLDRENLGNLFPHPAVVFFYYSHPPLASRLEALKVP